MGLTSSTMYPHLRRGSTLTIAAALCGTALCAATGCNPYEKRSGEYNAGAIDPIKFPAIYLGTGGTGKMPGMGKFSFAKAFANGKEVLYYPLAFNGRQGKSPDPLDLNALKPPLGYVFDPTAAETAPDSAKCRKPEGYVFDQQRDAVRYDRQGNIFVSLPIDSTTPGNTTYVPIVSEVAVTSNGNPCQDIKSEVTLVKRAGVDVALSLNPPPDGVVDALPTGKPDGLFRAFAIIDPAAEVTTPSPPKKGETAQLEDCGPDTEAVCRQYTEKGIGPQRWGWFKQYLLAYLDGGNIPLQVINPMGKLRMATQNLFVPTAKRVFNPETKMWEPTETSGPGDGLDIMEHKRGEDGYSPICRVWTFDPVDVNKPEKTVGEIDMMTAVDTKKYVYCLQAPPQ